jgi:hypothetical protein
MTSPCMRARFACATVRLAGAHGWLPGMARRTGSELREEASLFGDTMDSAAFYNGTRLHSTLGYRRAA